MSWQVTSVGFRQSVALVSLSSAGGALQWWLWSCMDSLCDALQLLSEWQASLGHPLFVSAVEHCLRRPPRSSRPGARPSLLLGALMELRETMAMREAGDGRLLHRAEEDTEGGSISDMVKHGQSLLTSVLRTLCPALVPTHSLVKPLCGSTRQHVRMLLAQLAVCATFKCYLSFLGLARTSSSSLS